MNNLKQNKKLFVTNMVFKYVFTYIIAWLSGYKLII